MQIGNPGQQRISRYFFFLDIMPTIFSFYMTNDIFLPQFLSQGTLYHDCKHSLKRIYKIKQTFLCFGDEYWVLFTLSLV